MSPKREGGAGQMRPAPRRLNSLSCPTRVGVHRKRSLIQDTGAGKEGQNYP